MVRPRFDPARDYTAARSFTYNGVDYAAGDTFDKSGLAPHRLNTLYGSRAVNMTDKDAPASDGITMTQTRPGYFEVSAPWLDEPEKVRGLAKAQARVEELREEGEPADHHGVSISGGEGGWYTLTREGLDGELKVQGEDEARKVATALRAGEIVDGQPDEWAPEHYATVVVEPVEGTEGDFTVSAPWLPGVETITGEDAANERADLIRKEGPPEGFDFEKAAADKAEAEEKARIADEEQGAKAQAEAAETSRIATYSDSIGISETITDGERTFTVTLADGEIETFDGDDAEDAANARVVELREAGPPEGWVPASDE